MSLICCLDDSDRCAISRALLKVKDASRRSISFNESLVRPNTNLSRSSSCRTDAGQSSLLYSHVSILTFSRVKYTSMDSPSSC